MISAVPDGTEAVCPTEDEIAICGADIELFGSTLPNLTGWKTYECTGEDDWECPVDETRCTNAMTNVPLPIQLRRWTDYLWQRNPFEVGAGANPEGDRQYAGSDYSVPYWNARRYGFLTEGQGQALAWRDGGSCAPAEGAE